MNILLMDGDEYFHSKFRKEFSDLGNLRIHRQASGASEAVREFKPDVIVSELLVGDTTVFELLEKLRPFLEANQCLVIIFTTVGNLEDVLAAMEMGANHYLIKGQDSFDDIRNLILTKVNYVQEPRT